MNRSLISLSVVGLLLSGCSNAPSNKALGSFEYTKVKEGQDIVIPEGLDKPAKQYDFDILPLESNGPVGESLDIRSPTLVLPVATSTRLEQNSPDAKVWFDQVLDDKELYSFIVDALRAQLKSDDVELITLDEKAKRYQSTWYLNEKESGMWMFSEVSEIESIKFNYTFDVKPHGRSVGLAVEVAGFMKTDETGGSDQINAIDKQRAEMNMLNNIIAQVDYQYRIYQQEYRLKRSNQKLVKVGKNAKSQPTFIVEMELEELWSNMPAFFESHGFKVTDLNEPKKTYYVDFEQPSNSMWAKLWGDEVPVIEIEDDKYYFTLKELGEDGLQTSVTIYREDGTPLSVETLEKVFPVIEPGLSFRSIF